MRDLVGNYVIQNPSDGEQKRNPPLLGLQREFRKKGIETQTQLVHGPVVQAIINVAERNGVDLIAMTHRGWSALSKVLWGSVSGALLKGTRVPLLLIRSWGDT